MDARFARLLEYSRFAQSIEHYFPNFARRQRVLCGSFGDSSRRRELLPLSGDIFGVSGRHRELLQLPGDIEKQLGVLLRNRCIRAVLQQPHTLSARPVFGRERLRNDPGQRREMTRFGLKFLLQDLQEMSVPVGMTISFGDCKRQIERIEMARVKAVANQLEQGERIDSTGT